MAVICRFLVVICGSWWLSCTGCPIELLWKAKNDNDNDNAGKLAFKDKSSLGAVGDLLEEALVHLLILRSGRLAPTLKDIGLADLPENSFPFLEVWTSSTDYSLALSPFLLSSQFSENQMIIIVQVVRVDLVKELPDSTVDATGHLPDPLKLVSVLHLVGFSLKNWMLLDLYTLV